MNLPEKIVSVLLNEDDLDISPEDMRSIVRPHLATFATLLQRHYLPHIHVQQWHTQIESNTKDMLAFVSVRERADGDIGDPGEFISNWRGTTISLEISLMGRQGANWQTAHRMKCLKVLKTYPENRADVVDLVKEFIDKTLREHMNGHRDPNDAYDWKAVTDGILHSLSDLFEKVKSLVPSARANNYQAWVNSTFYPESLGSEDIQGFVDSALGFGIILPRATPRRNVHFDHFSRQYDIGRNIGVIMVDAYQKLYSLYPQQALLKVRFQAPMLDDENFDVEIDMRKNAEFVISTIRKFLDDIEALKARYASITYSNAAATDLKNEVSALFEKVVEELRPNAMFVRI